MPVSACCLTTSATAPRMSEPYAASSYGSLWNRARIISTRSFGRARLPVWVARMRSVLCFNSESSEHGLGCPRPRPSDGRPLDARSIGCPRPLLEQLAVARDAVPSSELREDVPEHRRIAGDDWHLSVLLEGFDNRHRVEHGPLEVDGIDLACLIQRRPRALPHFLRPKLHRLRVRLKLSECPCVDPAPAQVLA